MRHTLEVYKRECGPPPRPSVSLAGLLASSVSLGLADYSHVGMQALRHKSSKRGHA